jgi:3-phosphoshikimate 1-carboxyvinyltransferase
LNVTIEPSRELAGTIKAPASKSYTHRMLVAAALSEGRSKISNPLTSEDSEATVNAVRCFGAVVNQEKESWNINGRSILTAPDDVIYCGRSAATIRFITPVAALAHGISVLSGDAQLRRRPIGPLLQALRELGVTCYTTRGGGYPPVIVFGGVIKGGTALIRGDMSSQFVSGLLFAAPRAECDVVIHLTTPLESRYYVDMTIDVLEKHGIKVRRDEDLREYYVSPRQAYKPTDHTVPGDYSSAAFILAAAAVTRSNVKVMDLERRSLQGDIAIVKMLSDMGAILRVSENHVEIQGKEMSGMELDVDQNPDLVPVLAVLGCYSKGKTVIHRAGRLRIKESNRLSSLQSELRRMGARIQVTNDTVTVNGPTSLRGTTIDPHNDHRIAMACSIAALGAKGKTIIENAECVKKSYPTFYKDLAKMGVKVHGR